MNHLKTFLIAGVFSMITASIAIAEEMTLVTRNTKHFEAIAEHFLLKLENWFEES